MSELILTFVLLLPALIGLMLRRYTFPSANVAKGSQVSKEISTSPIVEFRNVGRWFPAIAERLDVLLDVNLCIGHGLTAIVGDSGAGKSTVLNILAGIDRPSSGTVRFDGQAIQYSSEHRLRTHRAFHISMVHQDCRLIEHQTAEENVASWQLFAGVSRKRALSKARELLSSVGISDSEAARYPSQLSGGQRQRVALAAALAKPAKLLLVDEPTANLPRESAKQIFQILQEIADTKMPVIVVSHDHLVKKFADRVVLCQSGKLSYAKFVSSPSQHEIRGARHHERDQKTLEPISSPSAVWTS